MSILIYGIKNCDSVKKARKWFDNQELVYQFHDFRSDGLDAATLDRWLNDIDWKLLLNQRSTSWRQLDAAEKENIDADRAKALMLANPTLIKRPVIEAKGKLRVGFKETDITKKEFTE